MTLSRPDRMAAAGDCGYPLCGGDGLLPPSSSQTTAGHARRLQHYLSMSFRSRSKPEYTRVLAVLSGQPWISAISSSLKPW